MGQSEYEKIANQGLGLWSPPKQVFGRGLVVGKFYPPHRGHKYLIDTAAAACEQLTVMVCGRPGQKPEGSQRFYWLKEIHPDAEVILVDDSEVDDNDSVAWAKFAEDTLGYVPDAVFGSEEYISPWSKALGCFGIIVDIHRSRYEVSGTRVRKNPYMAWDYLEPTVRQYYAKRVCIVGAESTGKTTLARDLAEHFSTTWVPEYGREYTLVRQALGMDLHTWKSEEFWHIAKQQAYNEEQAARTANRVLIVDTDAMATGIWHEHFMDGAKNDLVRALASTQDHDLYIIPDLNTPFFQDGIRDTDEKRAHMDARFIEEMQERELSFVRVKGTPRERLAMAVSSIENLFPNRRS